ncbi:MAG: hypothetical protein K8L99_27615 [Anaerolineae bacterium]|nr:hypothetical protein [Anaerolineae bacterium]
MDTFQILAGSISSAIFMLATLPMLYKAWHTHDLSSYSATNITLSNIGNLIHWLYISSLPFGPIWLLHSFYTLSTLLMLIWYLMYRHKHLPGHR